jgi:hypothetical protein
MPPADRRERTSARCFARHPLSNKNAFAYRPRWRDIETLARVTGLTDQDVKDYLIELDARGSANNGKLWGLIERNPVAEAGERDPRAEC